MCNADFTGTYCETPVASLCQNTINDNLCTYYASLNLCGPNVFYGVMLLRDVCKKGCNLCTSPVVTTVPPTAAPPTSAPTSAPTAAPTTASTASSVCQNKAADSLCATLFSLGYCNSDFFFNGMTILQNCPKTCNVCSSPIITTQAPVITTTTASASCKDSQASCAFWANYCNQLSGYNPHPCRATCKLC